MTDRTQHVLDAIDGALEDWSVSGDAMRWTPQPVVPLVPFGAGHRRAPGFRGGRIPPPPQNGRGVLSFDGSSSGTVWFISDEAHVWPDPGALARAAVASELFGSAIRNACEAMARLSDVAADDMAPLHTLLELVDDHTALLDGHEDLRARALRLRRERNTGPSRNLVHQRRPRRVS